MTLTGRSDVAIFTVCNVAYLHKALVLAESLREHDDMRLKIYLVDRRVELGVPSDLAEILWIEEVGVPDLPRLAFKYDITEFGTSVKPFISLQLLEEFEKVIYLDPDICMYDSVEPIVRDLDTHPISLTPHYTTPQPATMVESDVGMMRFGSFNLGFYAVRRSDEGRQFCQWLWDRCSLLCYFETQFGLSTDQKWVSIAPCFFPNLHVSFNLGCNVAFWNAHERQITRGENGRYLVNGTFPLIYFHFSSFAEKDLPSLSTRPFADKPKRRADLLELSIAYKARLDHFRTVVHAVPYAFDFMSDGSYISPTLRRAYAAVMDELPANHDPFDAAGPVGAFARKNHLLEGKGARYVPVGFADAADNRGKLRVVNFGLRIILRVLGPNRSMNFSRLLVYLSSYRQNRDLWKV
jgi:hypothetical protein